MTTKPKQIKFKKGETVICVKRGKLSTDSTNYMDVDNIKIGDELTIHKFNPKRGNPYHIPTLQFKNKNRMSYDHDATNFKKKKMTEQDYLNEYENDKPRMRNFILLVITVAAIMAAMIYINI